MTLRTIQKILIANRGEIACRIQRTCRSLGISTVAVYSDADADMPFVREADEAVRIGPAPSHESYLRADAILDAAARTGADAVHPGYGFLAENADFADAVVGAGLTFIGPQAEAIRVMGSKREAKARVAAAGVPVVPGYDGADQDPAVLAAKALEIGLPVLLKASAGGGGKGMKRVNAEGDLSAAIASAKREARSAFGDDVLLVEKYIERPRHVEIQIFGDAHGEVVHLFERECSIQRRHQKVLEESPSPALGEALRARMGEAAVQVGRAIGYRNAGTVEFILGEAERFYFLEVNTRLQVEHPVTEMVTGIDLVREQIRVAEGRPLSFAQEELRLCGAALEARVYAEDSIQDLPQSGRILDWHLPEREGIRVDAGVERDSEVGIHYDPMLAKIVAAGVDREEARRRMVGALGQLSVLGLRTNRELLLHVLEHPAYAAGDIHTHFLGEHRDGLRASAVGAEGVARAGWLAALAAQEARLSMSPPPRVPSGFRNHPHRWQEVRYRHGEAELLVEYQHRWRTPGVFDVRAGDHEACVRVLGYDGVSLRVDEDGLRYTARVCDGWVFARGAIVALEELPRHPDPEAAVPTGGCVAPMPGKVVQVAVREGEEVREGQTLIVMEAMKMEQAVVASLAGVVEALHVAEGDQVEAGALLVVVSAEE